MKNLIENGTGHNVASEREHNHIGKIHSTQSKSVCTMKLNDFNQKIHFSVLWSYFSFSTIHAFTFLDESETVKAVTCYNLRDGESEAKAECNIVQQKKREHGVG